MFNSRTLVLIVSLFCASNLNAQTPLYIAPGTAATATVDTGIFPSQAQTNASVTCPGDSISYCLQSTRPATNISWAGKLLSSWCCNGRLTFWYYTDTALPASTSAGIFAAFADDGWIGLDTSGRLVLTNSNPTVRGTGTTTLSANTWYRISLGINWTNSTTNHLKLYLDGNLEIDITNQTFNLSQFGWTSRNPSAAAAGHQNYYRHIYVDDGTDMADPGEVTVTAKLPNSTNADNFTTVIGTCANHYDCVNERPLSEAKGFSQLTNTSQVAQSFGVQNAATGDYDISGRTILARLAWVNAKKGTETAAPSATLLTSNSAQSFGTTGTTIAVNLTTSSGDLVACALADQVGGSAPTIADTGGNSWTALNASTNTVRKSAWWSRVTGNVTTITVTFGSSAASRALVCGAFSEVIASPADTNPADGTDSTSPYDAPLSGTLATTDELVLGLFAATGTTAVTQFATSGTDTIAVQTSTSQADSTSAVGTGNTGKGGAARTTLTVSPGGTVNDTVIVVFGDLVGGAAPTIADDGGNTWTALTGGTNTVRCTAWYSRVTANTGTVTITFPSSSAARSVITGVLKGTPASPLDKNPAMTNDSTSPYASPSSGTLSQANEFTYGYGCMAGPETATASTDVTTALEAHTTGGSAGTNVEVYLGWKSVTATTAVTPTITTANNRTGITGTATFKRNNNSTDSDSAIVLSYRQVRATTSVAPQITSALAHTALANGTASFKTTPTVTATPQLIDNGTDNALTLSTASTTYTVFTPTSTYPSDAAGIGMKSGSPATTYFYEGGIIIASKPTPPIGGTGCTLALLGVGKC